MEAAARRQRILLLILAVLFLADWLLTWRGLAHGGTELNTLAKMAWEQGGPMVALLVKVIAFGVLFLLFRLLGDMRSRVPIRAAVAAYSGIVTLGLLHTIFPQHGA